MLLISELLTIKYLDKLLFFLLFLLLIRQTKQQFNEILSFDSIYPNSITLNNGNILIVAEKGIYLFDQYTNNINIIMNFTQELFISIEEDGTKTTFLQIPEEEGGNILILAKNILYIFSPDVIFLTSFNIQEETKVDYYCLSFFRIDENNNIFYTFGYSDKSKKFHLSYYQLNIGKNINELKYNKTYESIDSLGNKQSFFLAGITCERMDHIELGKLLVCFHENRDIVKEIGISIFDPEKEFELKSSISKVFITIEKQLFFIKSSVSKNNKKAFVCYLQNSGLGAFCFFYNIDSNTYTVPIEYSNSCKTNSMSMKTYYFSETNKFMFICGNTNINFKFIIFNSEDNEIFMETEEKIIPKCYGFYSPSISFLSKNLSYLIILDANCDNGGKRTRIFSIKFIDNINIFSSSSSSSSSPLLSILNSSLTISDDIDINSRNFSTITLFDNSSSISYVSIYNSDLSSISNLHNFPNSSISISSPSLISDFPSFSDLSSISNLFSFSSSYSSSNVTVKCKYLNYERNKCINIIPDGFYLFDENKGIIEKCHESCKICIKGPDEFSNNCNKCQNKDYYLIDGNCINNYICPQNKPLFNKIINECVVSCTPSEILEKECIINKVTENSLENIDKNINQIIQNLNMNNTIDIIIEGNNIIYQITTADKAKNNKYNNISTIDLGNCERKIKEEYGIDYIIVKKADININDFIIVKYELYNPNDKEQNIDLSICKEEKVQIYTPTKISDDYIQTYYNLKEQGYNILKMDDNFYNDKCTQFTSENNTDMILYDRKVKYYNINITYCILGCIYKKVDLEKKKIQCECPIKNEYGNKITDIQLDKEKLLDSFYKMTKYSNFKIITCYKLLFSRKGLFNNYGSFFLILIIILYIICGIRYYVGKKP